MPLTIPVIYGSVRHHRQGIGAARWIKHRLEQRGHEAPLIDPMAVGLPLLDMMYKEYKPGQGTRRARGAGGALPPVGRVS